jgi:hypothetical protein
MQLMSSRCTQYKAMSSHATLCQMTKVQGQLMQWGLHASSRTSTLEGINSA